MTAPALVLSELTTGDLDAVTAIERAASPFPWSRDLFAGELGLTAAQRLWLVGRLQGRLVAFGGVMFVGDDVHVMNLAVDPGHRRQGLASVLLGELLRRSIARGARHATLEVRSGNDAALALYRRFRLRPVGLRRDYYEDGADALVLWAHDIESPDYRSVVERLTGGKP
jgi:ribosomal-protein-alanine N-acetyltransferase